MTEPSLDVLQGTLDLLVLRTLAWQPMHGYGMGQWPRERTERALQIQVAALHQALRRLERKRLLEAEWAVTGNGRRARLPADRVGATAAHGADLRVDPRCRGGDQGARARARGGRMSGAPRRPRRPGRPWRSRERIRDEVDEEIGSHLEMRAAELARAGTPPDEARGRALGRTLHPGDDRPVDDRPENDRPENDRPVDDRPGNDRPGDGDVVVPSRRLAPALRAE